jgi:hypothetical protein
MVRFLQPPDDVGLTSRIAIEEIVIRVCRCPASTAPAILLRAGLFPCSPCHPTLAVDVQLLDFVMELFLNMAPNNTAFCQTLESLLDRRGFKLAHRVRIDSAVYKSMLN